MSFFEGTAICSLTDVAQSSVSCAVQGYNIRIRSLKNEQHNCN